MHKTKFFTFCILIIAMVFLLAKCKHSTTEEVLPKYIPTGNNNPTPKQTDTLCFSSDILPLIISTCAKPTCHTSPNPSKGYLFTSYTTIISNLNVEAGLLYYATNGSVDMPGLIPMDTASLRKLKKWIDQGAINSICNSCDTVNVKFSTHVFPIIQQNCLGCHTIGTITLLNNYTQVLAQVTNGKLYCAISQCGTYNPMPQGGAKLDACKIRAVKIWIDGGTANN